MKKFKEEYKWGICGKCGKRTLVRPYLDEKGNFMYWGNDSKGGMIRICKECENIKMDKKLCKERGIKIHSRRCWGCNQRNYRAGKTCQTMINELMNAKPSPVAYPISLEQKAIIFEKLEKHLEANEIVLPPTLEETEMKLTKQRKNIPKHKKIQGKSK